VLALREVPRVDYFTLDVLAIAAVLLITIVVMGGWRPYETRAPPKGGACKWFWRGAPRLGEEPAAGAPAAHGNPKRRTKRPEPLRDAPDSAVAAPYTGAPSCQIKIDLRSKPEGSEHRAMPNADA